VGKALEGVRVLDMTHVQSGASCAQTLAWMGADVVKLEAPRGDITRKPLRDTPDVDSFYVTVLRLPDQTVRLPGRRPPLTPAGQHKRGHLRSRTRSRRPIRPPQGEGGHLTNPPNNRQNRQRVISPESSPAQPRFREVVDSNGAGCTGSGRPTATSWGVHGRGWCGRRGPA
jgi:hypothetical protein